MEIRIMSISLHELGRRLKGFDIRQEAREAIIETKDEIVRLNQGQLYLGKRSDGSDLAPYSSWYAAYKERLSDPIASITDRRTLYLTGKWWNSIKVDVQSETFEVTNDDQKNTLIMQREGEKVLGLSKESKAEEYVPNYFFPALRARIERRLGIGFT
jgi:hypothetical protein